MKTKKIFLVTMVALFGVIVESSAQTTSLPVSSAGSGGTSNTNIGTNAGANVVGVNNTNLGFNSSANAAAAVQSNVAIGAFALNYNNTHSQTAVGTGALSGSVTNPVTGSKNAAFGAQTLQSNTTGSFNVALGTESMLSNTTGESNVAIGRYAMSSNTVGKSNIAIGYDGFSSNVSGDFNISIGRETASNISNGSNNLYIGNGAGKLISSGSNNIFIGNQPHGTAALNNTIIVSTGQAFERFRIDNQGRMGLGTQTPNARLEINGPSNRSGLRFTNLTSSTPTLSTPNGRVLTVDVNGDVVLTTDQGSGSSTSSNENLYTSDGVIDDNSTFDHLRVVDMNHNNINFVSNYPEYGKIYIGLNCHASWEFLDTSNQTELDEYKLFVEGGIITQRVKVALRNSADWADYVFADNYKLMPLNELETFVKENKHLPGIKSAEELSKSGIDVVDMQSKQMEKIEELTLYTIEQSKAIEKQAKELEELKAQVKALLERK
jgi:trimeric autotransporter adhesin